MSSLSIPVEYQYIYNEVPIDQQQSFEHSLKTVGAEEEHEYIRLAMAIENTIQVYSEPSPYWYLLYARISFVSTRYSELEVFYNNLSEKFKPAVAPFLGRVKAFQNAYEEAIELSKLALEGVNREEPTLRDVVVLFESNFTLGLSYAYTRQFEEAESIIEELEEDSTKFKYKKLFGEDMNMDYVFIENIIKGYTSFFAGKPKEMADVMTSMREWTTNLKDPWLQGFYFNIYGISRMMFNELAEGERAMRVAFKKFEQVHDLRGYSTVGANLGVSLINKGKRQEGREYLEAVIEPMISMKNYWIAVGNMLEVAKTLLDERKTEEARNMLLRAEEITDDQSIEDPNIYSMFCFFYSKTGDLNKSTDFLNRLQRIKATEEADQYTDLYYYQAAAINAMAKGDLHTANIHIIEGIEIADKADYFQYAVELSMIHLDIILKRYLVEQKSLYILKAIELIKDLTPLIEMVENPFYETLFYIMSCYLYLGVENYSDAQENFEIAELLALENQDTAQYRELDLYEQRRSFITRAKPLNDMQNVLFDEFVNNWLSDDYLPIFYTMEALRLLQNLQFEKTNLEQKQEDAGMPKLLFIVGMGGITVYTHRFDEDESIDEVLVGGFLSALTTFSQELFGGGMLTRIDQENHVVLMEKISDSNILVMIVDKETYTLRKRFKRFSSELSKMKVVEYLNNDQILSEYDPQYQILEGIVEIVFYEEDEEPSEAEMSIKEPTNSEKIETVEEAVEEELDVDPVIIDDSTEEATSEDQVDSSSTPTPDIKTTEREEEMGVEKENQPDPSDEGLEEDETEDLNQSTSDEVNEEESEDYVPSFMRYNEQDS